MAQHSKETHAVLLLLVGLLAWLIPGGGHFVINKKKHAIIIFVFILLTFCTGLYIGSIGVIDPVGAKIWYYVQLMNSPIVAAIGQFTSTGAYPVYGRPGEIGQIYTFIAGLLNMLCIVNAVYWAHLKWTKTTGE
jgi:hypothetical protein